MQVLDGEPWYDSPPKGKASTKTAKESAEKNREYREKRRQQQQSSGGGSSGGGGSKEDAAKEEVKPMARILEGNLWGKSASCPLSHSQMWVWFEIYAYVWECWFVNIWWGAKEIRLCARAQEKARLRAAKEAEAQLASDDDVVVSDIDEDEDDGFI
jgi:hypothetical protein